MYKHHTKNKGDLGVLKVKLDLFEKGFLILNPETEHAPFDLVVYKNRIFKRIQVKFRAMSKKGTIEVAFRNTHCDTKGLVVKSVDKGEIDIYAIYCPDTDQCYYLDPKQFNKSVALRVDTPRNKQNEGIHFVKDFRKVP